MARKPKAAAPPEAEQPELPIEEEVVVQHAEEPQDDLAASVAALKEQLAAERQQRMVAEQRANEAASREVHARNEVDDTNLQLITNAIHMVKGNNEALKAEYAAAMESSDFLRAAEIQQGMAENAAKLMELENGKTAVEQQPKRQPPPPPQQQNVDPVEQFARTLSPRSGDWVRRHPQYATDQRLFNKMVAAHNLVTADGIQPDTDQYFREVEGILRIAPAEEEGDASDYRPSQVTQRRTSSPPPAAAPVSRSAPGERNVMRLTLEEREFAAINKMSEEEYARHKLELKRAGKIN